MTVARRLIVTIDTEVDKDRHWRVSNPVSFKSVRSGIPQILSPLFDRFGVVPTYLLSAEVMEDPQSVTVLRRLGDRAELGTHLHAEFVEPERSLDATNMAGSPTEAVQCQYSREIEGAKLRNLTDLFRARFDRKPTAFRAGRFGLSAHSHELLAQLGYLVDSSVTPGLRWRYAQATLDYASWSTAPVWIPTAAGSILELPLSILPEHRGIASAMDRLPTLAARLSRRLLGPRARHAWLRPSWTDGSELIRYVERAPERLLVLMLHSMEIVPGASPYAVSASEVDRIVRSLHELFEYCLRRGVRFCGLSAAAELA